MKSPFNQRKMFKIFASHSSKDQASVHEVAKQLKPYGIELFVAHIDVKAGTPDYVERIKQGMDESDAFLFIENDNSINSRFCNQELGYAVALNKTVIYVCKEEPKDVTIMGLKQGATFRDIERDIPIKVIRDLMDNNSQFEKKGKAAKCLGINGFTVDECLADRDDLVYLKKIPYWDTSGKYNKVYFTSFMAYKGVDEIGHIRIACIGQKVNQHTCDSLPKSFCYLPSNFFSRWGWFDPDSTGVSEEQKHSLDILLNDVELYLYPEYLNEPVTRASLFRDESDKYDELFAK